MDAVVRESVLPFRDPDSRHEWRAPTCRNAPSQDSHTALALCLIKMENSHMKFHNTMIAFGLVILGPGVASAAGNVSMSSAYEAQLAQRLMDNMAFADANADGMVSKNEFVAEQNRITAEVFAKMDTNHDGMISHDEMMSAMHPDGGQ